MPWHVARSDSCPESKPWAVIKNDDGEVEGCHETEAAGRRQMVALYAQEDANKTMEQITLKAVATPTTDQGVFRAVISTESVDREKDVVVAKAMVDALRKWNRPIPLAWNHSTEARDIIGSIDPNSVEEVVGEVQADGQVDLESEVGREAWRSFKSRTIGFSFGYLILEAKKRTGGGRRISGLDVFEITGTPTPMNNDTRVLSIKAAAELAEREQEPRSEEELRREAERVDHARIAEKLPQQKKTPDGPGPDVSFPEEDALKAMVVALRTEMESMKAQLEARTEQELKRESDRVERQRIKETLPESDPPEPQPDVVEVLTAELASVKTELELVGAKLADQEKKAEEADKEPDRTRSADPLRKRSDQAVLEIQSDGISSRKPPKQKSQEPVEEAASEAELKARSKRQMLELLTGDMSHDTQ